MPGRRGTTRQKVSQLYQIWVQMHPDIDHLLTTAPKGLIYPQQACYWHYRAVGGGSINRTYRLITNVGGLWSGNFLCDPGGWPVLTDLALSLTARSPGTMGNSQSLSAAGPPQPFGRDI